MPSPCLLFSKNARFMFFFFHFYFTLFIINSAPIPLFPSDSSLHWLSLSFPQLLISHSRQDSAVWCQDRKGLLLLHSTRQDKNPHNAHLREPSVLTGLAEDWGPESYKFSLPKLWKHCVPLFLSEKRDSPMSDNLCQTEGEYDAREHTLRECYLYGYGISCFIYIERILIWLPHCPRSTVRANLMSHEWEQNAPLPGQSIWSYFSKSLRSLASSEKGQQ